MDTSEVLLELQKDLCLHNQNAVQLIESGQFISYNIVPPCFAEQKGANARAGNPWETAFYLAEGQGITFRHNTLCNINRKLR